MLGADQAPDFIDLESLAMEVLKDAILKQGCGLAGVHDEFVDSGLADAGEPGDCADAHSSTRKVNDFSAVLSGQPIHTPKCQTRNLQIMQKWVREDNQGDSGKIRHTAFPRRPTHGKEVVWEALDSVVRRK